MRLRATAFLAAVAAANVGLCSASAAQPVDMGPPVDTLAPLPASASVSSPELPQVDPLAPLADADAKPDGPSAEAVQIINWVLASRDNGEVPFMVIDKVAAEVFVFDAKGEFVGKTAALVGSAVGDDSSPGVGDRELSNIAPEDRTTPAGRFVAKFGHAYGNQKVLWVDYHTSISMHPVITSNKKEHRRQRLESVTPDDNRITYGCINVPRKFYRSVVEPLFTGTSGVVYILPETRPLQEVFLAFNARLTPARAPGSF
ncbi:hypothetical protein LZ016_10780 [Sphingomonas sp. SM33]|uniref:L,D-transpeptidase n=1 Tax=Sphingomonas telluris TaxID=2907998 RepID=A0ABS9VNN5_9SPHN|nr:hypothetical protein [Sphingomonas telluris]MCH8616582.1 hypothetical protein [Sphingomonas telluris]